MAIHITHGFEGTVKAAQAAGAATGKAQADMQELQNQHQLEMQRLAEQYRTKQLAMNLQADEKKQQLAVASDIAKSEQNAQLQAQLEQMQQQWEMQKLQLRSLNDFALQEKEHQLKAEYSMQKRMMDQVERDNKLKQLQKDVEDGRIDSTTVRPGTGMTEADEIYQQIVYESRPTRSGTSSDPATEAFLKLLNGSQQAPQGEIPAGTPEQAVQEQPAQQTPQAYQTTKGWFGRKKTVRNIPVMRKAITDAIATMPFQPESKAAMEYTMKYGGEDDIEALYKRIQQVIMGGK